MLIISIRSGKIYLSFERRLFNRLGQNSCSSSRKYSKATFARGHCELKNSDAKRSGFGNTSKTFSLDNKTNTRVTRANVTLFTRVLRANHGINESRAGLAENAEYFYAQSIHEDKTFSFSGKSNLLHARRVFRDILTLDYVALYRIILHCI